MAGTSSGIGRGVKKSVHETAQFVEQAGKLGAKEKLPKAKRTKLAKAMNEAFGSEHAKGIEHGKRAAQNLERIAKSNTRSAGPAVEKAGTGSAKSIKDLARRGETLASHPEAAQSLSVLRHAKADYERRTLEVGKVMQSALDRQSGGADDISHQEYALASARLKAASDVFAASARAALDHAERLPHPAREKALRAVDKAVQSRLAHDSSAQWDDLSRRMINCAAWTDVVNLARGGALGSGPLVNRSKSGTEVDEWQTLHPANRTPDKIAAFVVRQRVALLEGRQEIATSWTKEHGDSEWVIAKQVEQHINSGERLTVEYLKRTVDPQVRELSREIPPPTESLYGRRDREPGPNRQLDIMDAAKRR